MGRLNQTFWLFVNFFNSVKIIVVHAHFNMPVYRFSFEFVSWIAIVMLFHPLWHSVHLIAIISLISSRTVSKCHGWVHLIVIDVVVVKIVFFTVVCRRKLLGGLMHVLIWPLTLHMILSRIHRCRLRAHLSSVVLMRRCLLNRLKVVILLVNWVNTITSYATFGLLVARGLFLACCDGVEVYVAEIVVCILLLRHTQIVLPIWIGTVTSGCSASKTSKIHY